MDTNETVNAPHTCMTCRVIFTRAELQRDHYKSEWHRYNLKRKVADLPPVTSAIFESKVVAQKEQEEQAENTIFRCQVCYKTFQSQKTLDTHSRSKKHIDTAKQNNETPKDGPELPKEKTILEKPKKGTTDLAKIEKEAKTEECVADDNDENWSTDEDEGEAKGDGIPFSQCLFCGHSSADAQENLTHMSVQHGFFIPDAEYCVDVEGLLEYLGEKIGCGFVCLLCNDRGKAFHTLDAVQKHMRDKGHCTVLHEGEAMLEYSDYYDYSSSYPDAMEQSNAEDEIDITPLEERDWQLVLPSGATVGHRSLMRFYRQRLKPVTQVQVTKKKKHSIQNVLNHYKALGWTGTTGEAAARKAKDLAVMNKLRSKHEMKLGVKANKLQPHFRAQTLV